MHIEHYFSVHSGYIHSDLDHMSIVDNVAISSRATFYPSQTDDNRVTDGFGPEHQVNDITLAQWYEIF